MSSELTNEDYINILTYYKMDIPKSKRILKKQAENIISEKLGVTRILDPLLLKELLKFTPKLNVDRVVSFGLALSMAKSLNTRVKVTNTDADTRMKEYFRAHKKGSLFRTTSSPFRT